MGDTLHIAIRILGIIWIGAFVLTAVTADDFGRSVNLKRNVHEAASFVMIAPLLLLLCVLSAPFILADRRRAALSPPSGKKPHG